ncbi:hypothetical protein PVAND_003354 [Polypedilum vanderplanki]|uniref:PH domain-containing protein n=1 Tax=Polypedilum vanderplanki TaxID=319348 RepID=A0A9J6BVJ7_POLVA|nr:hypothetical protein PVAND_003354 [Polypedilum vanderplanki]
MGSSQNGICIKSSTAHLICLGNSRLSTEVTLFEIPIGNITIGNNDNCDIVLKGSGIQDVHCRCSRKVSNNSNNGNSSSGSEDDLGDVILSPIGNAKVYVEGNLITDDYILQQGDTITLGSIFLRFNFPAKAILLKNNAMESNKRSINDNYEVLKKNLNTNCVNFTEFSINADKTLNNNVKITEKMKNLKMKANDSYPKISNLQVYPSSSMSIENCANVSNGNNNNNNGHTASNNFDEREMQQLEDVLKMFVEYNNNNSSNSNQSSKNNISSLQTSSDKINVTHQNRIKTNGSLPKNFHTKDNAHNFEFFDSSNDSKTTDDIENYKKPTSPRTRIKTFVSSPTSVSSTKSLSPTDNNDKSYEYDKNGTTTSIHTTFESSSNEKDYEKLIKSFEEKFRMDIYNIQNCENLTHVGGSSSNSNDIIGNSNNLHSSNLNSEKNEILAKIRELKILISDIQYQESESVLDSDVEKTLVAAEMSNEKTNLEILNEKLSVIKAKMKQLEIERMKRQKQQEIQQIKLKNIIKDKEAEIKMLQEQVEVTIDTEMRLDELQKSLEMDIKTYEDLEFHYLEEETEWASLMEEYKEDINTFTQQIEDKKNYIHQLEQTKRENENSTQSEQKTLEKKLFNLKQRLENEREKLKNIDKLLSMKRSSIEENQSSKTISNSSAYDDENSSSSSHNNQNNITATTDIMSKSFNENMFFNRNKIEVSYFDFCLTTESLPRNSKIAPKFASINGVKPITRINESFDSDTNASPLMMPKYHSLSSINYSNDNLVQKMSDNNNVRNSNIANGATTSSILPVVQHRQMMTKQKRPLTRYLPNFSLDFNLKTHIETAGHQIQLCPHVIIDATSCRGYLNKVGTKPLFSNLNKRWFVFDREKQMFVYYSNKSEKKIRGGAAFSAISDVYFDHSSSLERTFIVKTKSRIFTLQAPSSQACSIWIDVVITGAQAKIFEYEK